MKEMRPQIRRPQSRLTLGAVVLITGLVLGFQQAPTNEYGQPGRTINRVASASVRRPEKSASRVSAVFKARRLGASVGH